MAKKHRASSAPGSRGVCLLSAGPSPGASACKARAPDSLKPAVSSGGFWEQWGFSGTCCNQQGTSEHSSTDRALQNIEAKINTWQYAGIKNNSILMQCFSETKKSVINGFNILNKDGLLFCSSILCDGNCPVLSTYMVPYSAVYEVESGMR